MRKKYLFSMLMFITLFLFFHKSAMGYSYNDFEINENQISYINNYNDFKNSLDNPKIKKIIFNKDITLNKNISLVKHDDLIIDGNGHTLDYKNNTLTASKGNENYTIMNMKIIGQNYYGPVRFLGYNLDSNINYSDIEYFGPQLLWCSSSSGVTANFYNKVSVHSLNKLSNGKSVNGNGNQQNMQVDNTIFHENSKFFGETYGGNCLELTGNVLMKSGSELELHPHTGSGLTENSFSGNSVGIGFSGTNSKINTDDNSKIKIVCNSDNITNDSGERVEIPNSKNKKISTAISNTLNYPAIISVNGKNSKIDIEGDGVVNSLFSSSLVQLSDMDININDGASFNLKQISDKPINTGVMNVRNGNFSANKGSTMNINSEIKSNSHTNSYLIYSEGYAKIRLNNPKEVIFDQNNIDNKYSKVFYNSNKSFIDAKDVSLQSSGKDNEGNKIGFDNPEPFHRIILPFSGNRIDNNFLRILGSYNDTKKLSEDMSDSIKTGKRYSDQFSMMKFTQMPTPNLDVSSEVANDSNDYIYGHVNDDNGKPLENAHIKTYLDGNKFYYNRIKNPTSRDIQNIINSNLILFNKNNLNIDNNDEIYSGKKFEGIKTDDFDNPMFYKYSLFNIFTDDDFDKHATINKSTDPYITTTDKNGNFKFKIPDELWTDIGYKKDYLNVVATYNYINSNRKKIKVKQKPKVDINSSVSNLSKKEYNKIQLDNIFQGDINSKDQGDTIEFINSLKNYSDSIDYKNLIYKQPIPNNVNENDLNISYNDGKTYEKLKSSDFFIIRKDNYKVININNFNIKHGDSENIRIIGNLSKKNNNVENNKININSSIAFENDDEDDYVNGNIITLSFSDGSISINPNNISFGSKDKLYNDQYLSSLSNENKILAAEINDNRTNKSDIKITAEQYDINFHNGKKSFAGEIFLSNKNNIKESILNNPVEIYNGKSISSIYWTKEKELLLKPKENVSAPGNYKTKVKFNLITGY